MSRHLFPTLLAASLILIGLFVPACAADPVAATHVIAVPATPTAGTSGVFDVGAALGWAGRWINTIVGALVTALASWLLWVARTKFKVDINATRQAQFTAWALRQASLLVAAGEASVFGLKVSVQNTALVRLGESALTHIPDILAALNITPDMAAQRVVAMVPHVPTVVALTQVQAGKMPVGVIAPTASAIKTGGP